MMTLINLSAIALCGSMAVWNFKHDQVGWMVIQALLAALNLGLLGLRQGWLN